MQYTFYSDQEAAIAKQFMAHKFVIVPVENVDLLNHIRKKIAESAAKAIQYPLLDNTDPANFLNNFHQNTPLEKLNDVRLQVISDINKEPDFRLSYFNMGKTTLAALAGNELAMQRRVNLSIQLPHDDSSLLPVHADVWSGDSPYEIVMWLPLVDCYETKSMFFTNAQFDEDTQRNFGYFKDKNSEDLFQAIKDKVEFLEVPFGSALFFSQNVMHGNRINLVNETRWSMNCRFKSLLTPYHSKKMGEFFEPITMRPLTCIGLDYQLPERFHE